jgi:hypothetical protein
MSNSSKGKKKSPEHCENISKGSRGNKKSPEHCENIRKSLKGNINITGENNGMFGKTHSDKSKKIIGEKTKRWVNEVNNGKPAFYGKKHTKESKEKMRCIRIKLFKDEDFLKKFKNSIKNYKIQIPNKQEIIILNILDEIIPEKYIFVGDFKLWINGKNPDFINESEKKIIELFGKHWHKEEDEKIRIDHFKKEGYDTLVIWDYELRDIQKIKEKILEFEKNEKIDNISYASG